VRDPAAAVGVSIPTLYQRHRRDAEFAEAMTDARFLGVLRAPRTIVQEAATKGLQIINTSS